MKSPTTFHPEILKARGDPRAGLDISKYRNSKLPEAMIISPKQGFKTGEREIKVTIEAKDTGSGIRDVRVFRNQTMIHFEHGDLKPDAKTGACRLTIPVKLVAGDNDITVYAFNHDNVKSKDAAIRIVGAESLKRKSTAYILSIGVNTYANVKYNLNYAVPDAEAMIKALVQALGEGKQDRETIRRSALHAPVVPLMLPNKQARKGNILAALARLAKKGKQIPLPPGAPDKLRDLVPAEPEDAVIVFFSGHGMAEGERYYLIPHDLGFMGDPRVIDNNGRKHLMSKSISDRELEQAFEHIDAGRIMLIIDACQSGQALESEEKRRGAMNSRGLAQLAYEKGMYLMSAAQSFQAALELQRLGHGLLTYVLVEGLKAKAADINQDLLITAEEWLDYATRHVGRESEEARERYVRQKGGEEIGLGEVLLAGQVPRAYYRRERRGDDWVILNSRVSYTLE